MTFCSARQPQSSLTSPHCNSPPRHIARPVATVSRPAPSPARGASMPQCCSRCPSISRSAHLLLLPITHCCCTISTAPAPAPALGTLLLVTARPLPCLARHPDAGADLTRRRPDHTCASTATFISRLAARELRHRACLCLRRCRTVRRQSSGNTEPTPRVVCELVMQPGQRHHCTASGARLRSEVRCRSEVIYRSEVGWRGTTE